MEVSYNLRYQKSNFANKTILDKEGEIIIYSKGFRLKGKGGGDKGELVNFSEIKEFYYRDNKVFFITFNKEKYILFFTETLFDQILVDIYKSRNEFLMDALFMRDGKLKAEFEGHFERVSKLGNPINKGKAKLRLHEEGLVVLPPNQDAFVLHYDFVNFYEFDDFEYTLKVVMDDGTTILFSQLSNDFELFREKMEELLGGMYDSIVNGVLREIFMEFHAGTLLKLAYKMKGGKSVSLKDIQKMDKELAVAVENFIFEDEGFKEKVSVLRGMVDEYNLCFGIAKDNTTKNGVIRWVMFVVPEKNVIAFSVLPRWEKDVHECFFYKIIVEKGSPADKAQDKILEVNQALVNLGFAKDPCYKDKRDLRHSPYQYAIRKLPYLRILRKSFLGKVFGDDPKKWQLEIEKLIG
jgi:hypothetical protein